MKSRLFSQGVVIALLAACGPKSAGNGDPSHTGSESSGSTGTATSTSDASGTGSPSSSEGTTTTSGSTGTGGSSEDIWEACAAAKSTTECTAITLDELGHGCIWGRVWPVEITDNVCDVGLPVAGCHPSLTSGGAGCLGFGPNACQEDPSPKLLFYREVAGTTEIWQKSGACGVPAIRDGEVPWIQCPHEEFVGGPAGIPPACYCLCGGIPPDGGSSDTGTSSGTGTGP